MMRIEQRQRQRELEQRSQLQGNRRIGYPLLHNLRSVSLRVEDQPNLPFVRISY